MSNGQSNDQGRAIGAALSALLLLICALFLPGCRGYGCNGMSLDAVAATCTPPPPPTPPPPARPAVVISEGTRSLRAGFIDSVSPFAAPDTGAVDVTVDWTFARNNVDAFVVRGSCTARQFVDDQCEVVMSAVRGGAKPERFTIPSLAAGTYTLLIGNEGPDDESVAWQVVLRPGA